MTWPDSTNENFKNCSTFDPSVDEGIRCAIIFDIVYPCAIAIFLCPFAVYFFLPFAKTPSFIPILNFILSFGLSTSAGTIFYLLIPSCLENPIDIPTEAQATIRHASTITTMCFWILFLWDKLSTYFFTKDVIDDGVQELERIEGESFQLNKAEKEEKRPTVITNRKLTLVSTARRTTRVTSTSFRYSKRFSRYTSNSQFQDRNSNKSFGGQSMMSVLSTRSSVVTSLPEQVSRGDVRLPSCKDFGSKWNGKIMGWLVTGSNFLSSFGIGILIAAAFNNNLAEGIALIIALIIQETLQKVSDFTVMQQWSFNPSQALLMLCLSSSSVFGGVTLGLFLANSSSMQWIFAAMTGFLLYSTFAVLLPELGEAEKLLVISGNSPSKCK